MEINIPEVLAEVTEAKTPDLPAEWVAPGDRQSAKARRGQTKRLMRSTESDPIEEFERLVTEALPSVVGETAPMSEGRLYRSVMARVELPLLWHVVELSGGNQLKAARLLGINRNTLRKRLRLLGLLPPSRGNGGGAT